MSLPAKHILGRNVRIDPTAELNVEWLEVGSGTIIGPHVVIEGSKVIIGREAWFDRGAYIGGGSAFDPGAYLVAGDFLHMGRNSHINIARGVEIGDEFGCGIETKVFTHGAYTSELNGFPVAFAPVRIGHRVWLPNAWVNPGVTIGDDVVVSARSLVNRSLPSGCLAAGVPCRVMREQAYPKVLDDAQHRAVVERILEEAVAIAQKQGIEPVAWEALDERGSRVAVAAAVFDLQERRIDGPVSPWPEIVRNQLRRHGIRFKFGSDAGRYASWESYGY